MTPWIDPVVFEALLRQRRARQREFITALYDGVRPFDLQMFAGFTSYDDIINAITTLGQANDYPFAKVSAAVGIAGYWHSDWLEAGAPGAGVSPAGTPGIAYDNTSSHNSGGITFANVSTKQRYGVSWGAVASQPLTLILVDRLVGVGGIAASSTGSKTISTVALTRYTSGVGVQAFCEFSTAATSTATAFAAHLLTYHNQAATASQVGISLALASGLPKIGDLLGPLSLAAGDTGIQSCETLNVDTAVTASGVFNVILVKPIAVLPLGVANVGANQDLVLQIAGLPQIFDTACLQLMYASTNASAPNIAGIVRTAYA